MHFEDTLSELQRDAFKAVKDTATFCGMPVYLVGGAVRDWLSGQPNTGDLDFTVEGDAIAFAAALYERHGGRIQSHERFRTASWEWADGQSYDLTTARSEMYLRPAALPNIAPADINVDLKRRDFAINAIALRMSDGALIDPFDGRGDLRHKLLRVLHPGSFRDDPTRLLRGARYAARMGYQLDESSMAAIGAGLPYMRQLSGERMKYDIELIFAERRPEDALILLERWGVFKSLRIPMPNETQLGLRYQRMRDAFQAGEWPLDSLGLFGTDLIAALGWGALIYNLGQLSVSRWIEWIPFTSDVRDTLVSLGALSTISSGQFKANPSVQSAMLSGFSGLAMFIGHMLTSDPLKKQALISEWLHWRKVRPHTTGEDLQRMGVPPGAIYGKLLKRLRDAWLDQQVGTHEEEIVLRDRILSEESPD